MKEEIKIITTARAIIVNQNNQLLLVKNEYNGIWFTPGGWLDGFETLEETCKREVYEETGLTIKPESLYKIDYFQLTKKQNIKWKENINKIEHYYICKIENGDILCDDKNKNLWKDSDKGNTKFIKFFTKKELLQNNIAPKWLENAI